MKDITLYVQIFSPRVLDPVGYWPNPNLPFKILPYLIVALKRVFVFSTWKLDNIALSYGNINKYSEASGTWKKVFNQIYMTHNFEI